MDSSTSSPDASFGVRGGLIGITGRAGHGKSTVANMICEMLPDAQQYSLASPLKQMALAVDPRIQYCDHFRYDYSAELLSTLVNMYGWDVAKRDPEVRRFLQRLGTEGVRGTFGDDAWVELMQRWWRDDAGCKFGVIPDVRFPNELAAVDVSMTVYRPAGVHLTGENAQHASERVVLDTDHVLVNRGDLEHLRAAVRELLVRMGLPLAS